MLVGVELSQDRIEPHRVVVVEQKTHAHAAVRRAAERIEQKRSRHIVVPDVILGVEGQGGGVGEVGASGKCLGRVIEGVYAGRARLVTGPGAG